jgi:hypothetical protein
VGLRARSAVFSVQRRLQADPEEPLTAVLPGVTLDELWKALGVGEHALRLMGALVALASLAGLVSVILAGLDARRRELAILRSVGASPRTLVLLLLTEGTLACLGGIALGVAAGAFLTVFAVSPLQAQFGIALGTDFLRAGEWLACGGARDRYPRKSAACSTRVAVVACRRTVPEILIAQPALDHDHSTTAACFLPAGGSLLHGGGTRRGLVAIGRRARLAAARRARRGHPPAR